MIKNIFLSLVGCVMIFSSCQNNDIDTTPPQAISNVTYRATEGGAVIYFTQSPDADVLYTQASYTNAKGESVFRVSSYLTDSVEIEGFVTEEPQMIQLYAVDRAKNFSAPVEIEVTPKKSFIFDVSESIQVSPRFGGVTVEWHNPAQKPVYVYLYYTAQEGEFKDKEYYRILASSDEDAQLRVTGLDSVNYTLSYKVQDFSNNETEIMSLDSQKPLFEQKIDKTTWTALSGSMNGDAWEGKLVNFWDDVVDTAADPSDNSYFIATKDNNGGVLNFPLQINLDLEKYVIANRFVVNQRAFLYENNEQNGASPGKYFFYNESNIRSFRLSCSADNSTWVDLGTFDIGDPRDAEGNISNEAYNRAIEGHEFEFEEVSPVFRYLKFEIVSNFGNVNECHGSELTLYGEDNLPNP